MPDDRFSVVDGLVMRESGEWAKHKLYYVARYMHIFTAGMKNKWQQRMGYVDLMAGPGRCYVRETGEEFAGSPVLAIQNEPQFDRLVFVENNPESAAALTARTVSASDRRTVLAGDCNDSATIKAIRAVLPAGVLTLAFVDLLGLDVPFETVAALTEHRKMDLAVTFPGWVDINRNIAAALNTADGERLDRFFGAPEWRDVVRQFERGGADRPDLPTALADHYGSRLRTLGYPVLEQLHRTMRNNRNAPLYRLLLASKHPRGGDFFRKIAAIEHDGQRGFRFDD